MTDYASSFNSCVVDLGALARNYKRIARFSRAKVMAVIKGDAYGHGLVPCGQALVAAGCDQLGVLDLSEALALKRHGLGADITVLAGLHGLVQGLLAVEAGLVVMAYDLGQVKTLAKAAEKLGQTARIRLKIDTGMGRLGIPWEIASYTISNLATINGIKIEGLATHLATNGDDGAKEQLYRFFELAQKARGFLASELPCSVLASGGILAHQEFPDSLSRVGLLLYGYSPLRLKDLSLSGLKKSQSLVKSLEQVMTVKTILAQVREAKAGETVGYDRAFKATKTIRLGTAPIGYVHGVGRSRSSLGHALVGGQKANLLGRVCMNLTMYDLSGIQGQAGDETVIMGKQGNESVGADQLAAWENTSAYEILCKMGRLNPREYRHGPASK